MRRMILTHSLAQVRLEFTVKMKVPASITKANSEVVRQSAERLSTALMEVVNRLALSSHSPNEVARRLKVHRTITSRLLSALRMSDPLAIVANIPGRQGLTSILQASEPIAGREAVGEARNALDEFENLIENNLGGREVLDIALGAWLPEMREKQELSSRQQIYRGYCGIAGASADVTIGAGIRFANEDGEHADLAMIFGLVGLRRLSPGRAIPIGSLGMIPGVRTPTGAYIEELPVRSEAGGLPTLDQFCSSPLPALREIRLGNYRQFVLPGEEVGNRSKVNIFTALVVRKIGPLHRPEGTATRRTGGTHVIEVPTRIMQMDMYVTEDHAPLRNPQLLIHRTGQRGAVDPNDPMREIDRQESFESIQHLGRGPERFGSLEVARYPEILRYVCTQVGLDSTRLVGHRCRVQFPLPNVQYSLGYEMPTRAEAGLAAAMNGLSSVELRG